MAILSGRAPLSRLQRERAHLPTSPAIQVYSSLQQSLNSLLKHSSMEHHHAADA